MMMMGASVLFNHRGCDYLMSYACMYAWPKQDRFVLVEKLKEGSNL